MQTEEKNIMFELKGLDRLLGKTIEAEFRTLDDDDQITRMHHWIIGFLHHNSERDIFQRDIEAQFKISRSTTSSMLTLMEKKGLIMRLSVPGDARLKKLVLTERAENLHLQHMDKIRMLNEKINGAITAAEKAELLRIIEKLSDAAREIAEAGAAWENRKGADTYD